MTVDVRPTVIHKRSTEPRLLVRLDAPGQTVTGYLVVRRAGSILAFEPLTDGSATLALPAYRHKGTQTVSVEYLGSDLAEPVSRQITFTVQN